MRRPLPAEFEPTLFEVEVPEHALSLLDRVEWSLIARAAEAKATCWGHYYTAEAAKSAERLNVYEQFAAAWPAINYQGNSYPLRWIRYAKGSLTAARQPSYHLDADPVEGLAHGNLGVGFIPRDLIWRINVNLFDKTSRQLAYLGLNVEDLHWQEDRGFISLHERREGIKPFEKNLVLGKRIGALAQAAHLCVSRVAHAGRETKTGHFMASFARVEGVHG